MTAPWIDDDAFTRVERHLSFENGPRRCGVGWYTGRRAMAASKEEPSTRQWSAFACPLWVLILVLLSGACRAPTPTVASSTPGASAPAAGAAGQSVATAAAGAAGVGGRRLNLAPEFDPKVIPVGAEYPCLAEARKAFLDKRFVDARKSLSFSEPHCAPDDVFARLRNQVLDGGTYWWIAHGSTPYLDMKLLFVNKTDYAQGALLWLLKHGVPVVLQRAHSYCTESGMTKQCFDTIAEIDVFASGSEAAATVRETVTRAQEADRHDLPIVKEINRLLRERAVWCRKLNPRRCDWPVDSVTGGPILELDWAEWGPSLTGKETPSICPSLHDRSPKSLEMRARWERLVAELQAPRWKRPHTQSYWKSAADRCGSAGLPLPDKAMLALPIPPLGSATKAPR